MNLQISSIALKYNLLKKLPGFKSVISQEYLNLIFFAQKHVRALFDYDSFDDAYLPCRELGLNFLKGEILKIMSTDDQDWWQAHKDSDQDNHLSLAGLIPSHQFQHKFV